MYRIFDQVLDSSIALPELEPADGAEPAIRFEMAAAGPRRERGWEPVHEWVHRDGTVTLSCARRDGIYRLRFPRQADFHISENGGLVRGFPEPAVRDAVLRHLLLDQVVPRVLGHRGRLVVHASAVTFDNCKAVAFLGDTGLGKSTLAAALGRQGARLATDDCLLLECRGGRVWGIPAYPGLRLKPDSVVSAIPPDSAYSRLGRYGGKQRLKPGHAGSGFGCEAVELAALFLLSPPGQTDAGQQVSIDKVSGGDAAMALIAGLFTLEVADAGRAGSNFFECGRVINAGLPVFRLDYPRSHQLLDEVCRKVAGWLESDPGIGWRSPSREPRALP